MGQTTGTWRRVVAAIGGEPDKFRAIGISAVMIAAITTWRFIDLNPFNGIGLLYTIPVALVAVRFGIIGGLIASAVCLSLSLLWSEFLAIETIPMSSHVIRGFVYVAVALVIGWQMHRRFVVEREAARWFELSHDMLCVADFDGELKRVNGSWKEMLGYDKEDLVGRKFFDFIHPDDLAETTVEAEMLADTEGPKGSVSFENRYRAKDGKWHWLTWSSRVIDGQIFAAARDVSDRKSLEMRLETLASEDPLTGIANRRAWDERFNHELMVAHRDHQPLTVIVLDLDGLKEVNDAMGHAAGDRLLVGSVSAWRETIRRSDFIARLGGDEFGVLLPASDERDAIGLVERMLAAMPMNEHFSAGIARWNGEESAGELTRRADRALYRAKNRQRGSWSVDSDASPIIVRSQTPLVVNKPPTAA